MFEIQLPIELGLNLETNSPLSIHPSTLATHLHAIGATGTGKTTSLEALIYALLVNGDPNQSFFYIDFLGASSRRLLRFLANPEFCDQSVRDRVVYYKPSCEEWATTMHTLDFTSRGMQDFKVERTMELILRGFESQELAAMPRLRLWLYRCLFGLTLLGFPLAVARYLLHPKLPEHRALLAMLPPHEQAEWNEILKETRGQAAQYLEAARNRISMLRDYIQLQRLFGSLINRFDIARFMEEGKIVILDLSPGNQTLGFQAANMIGGMVVNEIFNQGLTRIATGRQSKITYLFVDEFHRLVGPDILDFLPLVRNAGIRLMLANQSFSQLVQGEMDLRPLIAQARTRLMFANDFLDADILAEEVANFKWDPDEVKRVYESYRQRIAGYQKIITQSWGNTMTGTKSWTHQESSGRGEVTPEEYWRRQGSTSRQHGSADIAGGSRSEADIRGSSEHYLPIHEEFSEIVRVDYRSREEIVHRWRQNIRAFQTGECLAKLANDPELYRVLVNYLPEYDDPWLDRAVEELIARNYEQGPFIRAEEADRELEQIRQKLLTGPKLVVPPAAGSQLAVQPAHRKAPFRD